MQIVLVFRWNRRTHPLILCFLSPIHIQQIRIKDLPHGACGRPHTFFPCCRTSYAFDIHRHVRLFSACLLWHARNDIRKWHVVVLISLSI